MTTPGTAARSRPSARQQRLPGDADMWVMVLGDLFFFGCYFVAYMVFRAMSTEEFTTTAPRCSPACTPPPSTSVASTSW